MRTTRLHDAFLDRLDRHRGILVRVAGAYCREAAAREDLMQEIIVQLWRSYRRFDERATFSTWMYRIALNAAISFSRREARAAERVELVEGEALERLGGSQEAKNDDAFEMVGALVERLDGLNRALMLLYLDDNSYAEIASILGISETNVATKISRIKQRLKREIAPQPRT